MWLVQFDQATCVELMTRSLEMQSFFKFIILQKSSTKIPGPLLKDGEPILALAPLPQYFIIIFHSVDPLLLRSFYDENEVPFIFLDMPWEILFSLVNFRFPWDSFMYCDFQSKYQWLVLLKQLQKLLSIREGLLFCKPLLLSLGQLSLVNHFYIWHSS